MVRIIENQENQNTVCIIVWVRIGNRKLRVLCFNQIRKECQISLMF